MQIHFYGLCWNDRHMLDYFFRHYEPWIDRFFIFDDGSDDGSVEYLASKTNVELSTFVHGDPTSLVLSGKQFSDEVWRPSSGLADWVVIADLDEHLWHSSMRSYLALQQAAGVTAIPALGYQMVSRESPRPDALLWRDCPIGAPWARMSKLSIFRPDLITATDFAPGRHSVQLRGEVVYPERDEVANYHFKYMGFTETLSRHMAAELRLKAHDREQNWGHRYRWTSEQLDADFAAFEAIAVDTSKLDHDAFHAAPRWWR